MGVTPYSETVFKEKALNSQEQRNSIKKLINNTLYVQLLKTFLSIKSSVKLQFGFNADWNFSAFLRNKFTSL